MTYVSIIIAGIVTRPHLQLSHARSTLVWYDENGDREDSQDNDSNDSIPQQ